MNEIQQIEQICIGVQSPNDSIRKQAETMITQFNQMKNPYVLCFTILQQSKVPLAHFYTLMTIRDASIREWTTLSFSEKHSIVDTLLNYIESENEVLKDGTTRRQAYNALAVVTKRSWMDSDNNTNTSPTSNNNNNTSSPGTSSPNQQHSLSNLVMTHIYSLIERGSIAGVGLSSALVSEMAGASKSAPIHLTWDYHAKVMAIFQKQHLFNLFKGVMELLIKIGGNNMDNRVVPMLLQSLHLLVEILEWQFVDGESPTLAFLSAFPKSNQSSALRPPIEWAPAFTSTESRSNIVDLVFHLYTQVKNHKEMSHLLRVAMTKLSCLTGPVTKNAEHQSQYCIKLLQHLTPLLSNAIQQQSSWAEMEDLSNLLYRFCGNFKFTSLLVIPLNFSSVFIENLSKFILSSLNIMKITIEKGEDDLENEFENECFGLLLRAWVSLLTDAEALVSRKKHVLLEMFNQLFPVLKNCNDQIYITYVKIRIQLSHLEIDKDITDHELDQDKNKYNEQLKMISYVGRISAGVSMGVLKNEIDGCVNLLLQKGGNVDRDCHLVLETLHWLMLLSGHLLFDSENKGLAALPNPIEDYCNQVSTNANPEPVVELSNSILRYAIEYEAKMMEHFNGVSNLSPLVAETSMWFLSGWSLVYLAPSTSLNPILSPKLLASYGVQAVGPLIHHLMKKIMINLKFWGGEMGVLDETCTLFNNLSLNAPLNQQIVSGWGDLFPLRGHFDHLIPSVQGKLFLSFTNVIYTLPEKPLVEYFQQLAQPLRDQFTQIFQRIDLPTASNDVQLKEGLYILLERMKGVVSTTQNGASLDYDPSVAFVGTDLFLTFAGSFVKLLPIFNHNNDIVTLILNIFSQFTKNQLEYVDEQRAKTTFLTLIDLFKTISSISVNNKNQNIENKDYYDRIKMIVKILYNLINSNLDEAALIEETVLNGICVVVPCITNNGLLQYTKLSSRFFSILQFLFSSSHISLTSIPQNISHILFNLIEVGITHHDTDIAKNCLDSITAMTKNLNNLKGTIDVNVICYKMIGSMLNFLLLQEFNMDELLFTSTMTLVELIVCCREGYHTKIIELIKQQDPNIQPRIVTYFDQLISNPPSSTSQLNIKEKEAFVSNLRLFITNVKPLLSKK